jgi:RND family efflux transporter MFP subunit
MNPDPGHRTVLPGLLLIASGCADAGGAPGASRPATRQSLQQRQVRVVRAATSEMRRVVTVTGSLAAEESSVLSFKVAGRLQEILVDLGSRVAAGDPIARLDPRDFELRVDQSVAEVRQARARLGLPAEGDDDTIDAETTGAVREARAVVEEARLTRDRLAGLWESRTIPRSEVDAGIAALQVAEARLQDALEEVMNRQALLAQKRSELETARQQLANAVLDSPFAGAVRQRIASPAEYLAAGAPVALLVRVHPLRLRLQVPERETPGIQLGQRVTLSVEGDTATYAGHVARLSPAIDERSRTLMVEAQVPNERELLRPGAFVRAEILVGNDRDVVTIPASSVVVFAGIEKVITVRDGRAAERRIFTGRREDERVEVLSGLAAGDEVIADPGNLTGGQAVTVVN